MWGKCADHLPPASRQVHVVCDPVSPTREPCSQPVCSGLPEGLPGCHASPAFDMTRFPRMSHAIASSPVRECGPATGTRKTAASPMLKTAGAWLAGVGRSPARILDVQPAIVRVPASALLAMRSGPRIVASCTRVGRRAASSSFDGRGPLVKLLPHALDYR